MVNKINVLSLFDGISCGQVALGRAGIKINKYFASEILKPAIDITKKNYPDTIQVGDVTTLDTSKLPKIDLLMGGSPCNDVSLLKRGAGLKGSKSKLFYEYVRILNEVKPKYFLLENVNMKKEWQEIITKLLGVGPIALNSNSVSAQDRKRLYWTNIPQLTALKEKRQVLKDILIPAKEVEDKFWYDRPFTEKPGEKVCALLEMKGHDLMKRVYHPNYTCGTLTACKGGNVQKKVFQNGRCRKLTPLEYERLQTLPDNYTEGIANTNRYNACGEGWTVDIIAHLLGGIVNGR